MGGVGVVLKPYSTGTRPVGRVVGGVGVVVKPYSTGTGPVGMQRVWAVGEAAAEMSRVALQKRRSAFMGMDFVALLKCPDWERVIAAAESLEREWPPAAEKV